MCSWKLRDAMWCTESTHASLLVHHAVQCVTCESFHLQAIAEVSEARSGKHTRCVAAHGPVAEPACSECGSRFRVGGPVWSDPIHSQPFVDDMISMVSSNVDAGLSPHPDVLPESDTGSNNRATVLKSRARLLDILRACRNEVSFHCSSHITALSLF